MPTALLKNISIILFAMLLGLLLVGCGSTPAVAPLETQPTTKQLPEGAYEIAVDARAGWVTTTLDLKEGQTLKCRADGQWGESPGVKRTADGGQAGMFGSGYWGVRTILPDQTKWGCLVGRIGGGPPFAIGSVYTMKVDRPGLLQLSINDGLEKMSDNHGILRVHITIQP
jgi:hypothetical protein